MKLAITLTLLASGCSLVIDSGKYVGTGRDGGQVDDRPTPPFDGGHEDGGVVVPPNTVYCTAHNRFVSATDEQSLPVDFSTFVIQALLPDPEMPTGFRSFDGVGGTDGTIRIDGVPDGTTFYLKLIAPGAGNSFYVTDSHRCDLDTYVGGRPDSVPVSLTQTLNLNIANMQAWGNNDEVIAEEYNTATEEWDVHSIFEPALVRGATSLTASYDYACTIGLCYSHRLDGRAGLIDASRGDSLQLAHIRSVGVLDANGRLQSTSGVVDLFERSDIMMMPGVPVTLTGAFTPVTQDQTVRFQIIRSVYDAAYTDGQTQFDNASLTVWSSPGTDRNVLIGFPIAGVNMHDWSRNASLNSTVDVRYGDPLPSAWPRILFFEYDRLRWFRLPGESPRPQNLNIRRMLPFATPVTVATTLFLAPPTNIEVAGEPGSPGGRATFDFTAPLHVSWNPVAQASYFTVIVMRVYADGPRTRFANVATLTTRANSIDVPAEVFTAGEYFYFIVRSVQDGGLYAQGHLRLPAYPRSEAGTITGMFRLGTNCGNGTVDAGEACDPGAAATATCDIDCTPVLCGDGLANAAAGEECDSVFDSAGCDGDCTLPVCGDGYWNPQTEDCDDGNTLSGNGCTGTCRANNVCGNSIVEGLTEQCDDGNTTDDGNGCDAACHANNVCGDGIVDSAVETCDTMGELTATCVGEWCQTSVCGDNYVNDVAGEQCDDGGDSPGCDGNGRCRIPMCGDGYINGAAGEQCDPPGGACSPTCTVL